MAINPSDISNIGLAGGSPVEAMAQGYKLADLVDQRAINKMKMAGAQQDMQDMQTLKSLSSKYDVSTPEGQAQFAAEAIKVNPEMGLKIQKQFTESQTSQNELTKSQYDIFGKKLEIEAQSVAPLWQQASQMQAQGRSQQEIDAALLPAVSQTLKTLSQQTLPNGKPVLSQEEIAGFSAKLQQGNVKGALDGIMMNHAKGAELLKSQQQKVGRPFAMTGEQGPGMYVMGEDGKPRFVGGQATTAGGGGDGGPKVHSSKILDDGTVVNVMADGKVEVETPNGEKVTGEKRRQVLEDAALQGANIQGERARARQTATDAAKTANQAFGSVQSIRSNISNLKEAVAAIDAGANTGVIASRFPNLTNASIELQNIQSKLGLDVIGAVTFGALSEGELNLALQTALPTQLDPPALKEWLTKRIAAQEKLSDYLTKQATYLSKPGNTQAGWMEKMQNEAGGNQGGGAQAGGAQNYQEGQTATNAKGDRMIFRGGEWQPMQ
jgi:hypothetical protein